MLEENQPDKDQLFLAASIALGTPFGGTLCLAPDVGKPLMVDGNSAEVKISDATQNMNPTCTISGQYETLVRVLAGERALENAYLSGRIKIFGDMSLLARLKIERNR